MKKDAWENYFYDDSDVLKNKLGITDKKTLEDEERKITLKRLTELQLEPINGNFDIKHLKDIHKHLFFDIYPFAGEFRTCTLAKTTRAFYDPEMILDELTKELNELNASFDKLCTDYKHATYLDESFAIAYATILSDAYYQLMTIHPFREGNGRCVREFLREFVYLNNNRLSFDVELDYSKMDKERALQAVEYKFIFPSNLMMEFKNCLVQKQRLVK